MERHEKLQLHCHMKGQEKITTRVSYGKARETTAVLSYEGTGENYN